MLSNRRVSQILFVVLALISCSLMAFAQGGGFGAISGRVADPGGLSVAGAKVQAIKADTNTVSQTDTNEVGLYSFPSLPPGTYRLIVQKAGFQQIVNPDFELHVADSLAVNFTLQVGSISQTVTVTGEAAVVNTENSTLGGLVNESRMADLPLNGRNYVDLVTMQAGINVAATASSTSQSGGVRGTYFSADGAPFRANLYTLDGAITLNARGGTTASESGTSLGVDGTKEFKVVTGTFGAEYGTAMGGQVNMVSKGGGNQLHGDIFEYLRNSDLDARNFFDYGYLTPGFPRLPHFERNNFGAAAGGPIKKDKTFIFAAYEGLRQITGQTILDTVPPAGCHGAAGAVITPANCSLVTSNTTLTAVSAPLLALYPNPNVPGVSQFTFPSPSPSSVNWGQIRIDQNFSSTDTLFGRYTTDKSFLASGFAGLNTPTGVAWPQQVLDSGSYDQFVTISENHVFSPSLLNTARMSYSRVNFLESVDWVNGIASLEGPQYSFATGKPIGTIGVTGLSTWGASSSFPTGSKVNYYQLNDDLFYSKGKHALKFGWAGIKWNVALDPEGAADNNDVAFSSFTNFLKGVPSTWSGLVNAVTTNLDRNFMYYSFGWYANDDWHVTPRLTVNLGVRYEFMTQPNETNGLQYGITDIATNTTPTPGPIIAPPPKHNFSPRLGFADDLFGNGKTVVRGGFGIYYDVGNILGLLQSNQQGVPPLVIRAVHNNALSPETWTLPLVYQPSETGLYYANDYNLKTPHILKWNLTLERQLPAGMGLSATYDGSRGLNLYQGEDGNPMTPAAFVNGVPFWNGTQARANPKIPSTANFTETGGNSKYDALMVQFNKRMTHGLQFQTTYTWSHLLNDTESQYGQGDCNATPGMAQPVYPSNPSLFDYGPACYDITQTLRFNGLYRIPEIKSDNFAAKLEHGWWVGGIYTFNTGYPFMPTLSTQRQQTGNGLGTASNGVVDRPNIATAADASNCPSLTSTYLGSACKVIPVPYNPSTVITGNPYQWYNPNMFVLAPMEQTPGGALCTVTPCYGTLGNVSRGMLRGPHLSELDFSLNKDTRVPWFGEQGSVEFRAEIFNILNHPNFAMPTTADYSGAPTDISPYSEAPSGTAGRINSTFTTSRQIQFALRIIF